MRGKRNNARLATTLPGLPLYWPAFDVNKMSFFGLCALLSGLYIPFQLSCGARFTL